MLGLLDHAEVPTLVVATKIDKVKRSQRHRQIETIRTTLELHEDAYLLPISGVTGEGMHDLWAIIDAELA